MMPKNINGDGETKKKTEGNIGDIILKHKNQMCTCLFTLIFSGYFQIEDKDRLDLQRGHIAFASLTSGFSHIS